MFVKSQKIAKQHVDRFVTSCVSTCTCSRLQVSSRSGECRSESAPPGAYSPQAPAAQNPCFLEGPGTPDGVQLIAAGDP